MRMRFAWMKKLFFDNEKDDNLGSVAEVIILLKKGT